MTAELPGQLWEAQSQRMSLTMPLYLLPYGPLKVTPSSLSARAGGTGRWEHRLVTACLGLSPGAATYSCANLGELFTARCLSLLILKMGTLWILRINHVITCKMLKTVPGTG